MITQSIFSKELQIAEFACLLLKFSLPVIFVMISFIVHNVMASSYKFNGTKLALYDSVFMGFHV